MSALSPALEPTQRYTVTRADLVALRRGQRRPQPDPPGRGGRPQRRAARRDRPRHVHDGAGRPRGRDVDRRRRGRRARLQVHQPGRRPRRRRAASRSRSPARSRSVDGRAGHDRAHGHLRRPEGARHAQGSRACLSCLADHTTLRLGGPAPRRSSTRHHRGRAGRGGRRRRRGRRAGARARRRQQPRRRRRRLRRARSSRSPPAASPRRRRRRRRPAAACWSPSRPARPGTTWSPRAVERGWVGVEALSGIPGSVGATPIQNVGAYGQEVAQTIASVRVWDRELQRRPHLRRRRLRLRLPHQPVQGRPRPPRRALDVTFQLRQGSLGAPVAYAELARTLGVELGQRAPLADVRDGGARPARRQGHGARRRPTTTPGAPARSSPTRSSTADAVPDGAPGLAAARRHGQDERRLADRARRLRQGLRQRARSASRPSTPSR